MTDVVIIGAGVMGAATAFWLAKLGVRDVTLIERDTAFARASTALSASGIRQQFSDPLNIAMSQFTVEIIRNFANLIPEAPALTFHERGYLICTAPKQEAELRRRVTLQQAAGAGTIWLTPDEVSAQFPGVKTDDIAGASWGSRDEGWFDGQAMADAFRRASGARIIKGDVTSIDRIGPQVTAVNLADGSRITCGAVVNAAGPHAAHIAEIAGISLPVSPRKRDVFCFHSDTYIPDMPLITDASGMYVRPEGAGFIAGMPPSPDCDAASTDFETDHAGFETHLWPALAHRIPGFERLKLTGWWTGHYEFNTVDQNAIIGPHPEVANYYFINGFSGHGLQQAAAAGRGIAEKIVFGAYQTLDLTPFAYDRLAQSETRNEAAVI